MTEEWGDREMQWETLLDGGSFGLRRAGRFLVADLKGPHLVMSTSVRHGGQADHLRQVRHGRLAAVELPARVRDEACSGVEGEIRAHRRQVIRVQKE